MPLKQKKTQGPIVQTVEPPPDVEFLQSLGFDFRHGGCNWNSSLPEIPICAFLNFPLRNTEQGSGGDVDDELTVMVENPAMELEHCAHLPLSPPVSEWRWSWMLDCNQFSSESAINRSFGPMFLRERWEIRAFIALARLSASRSMFAWKQQQKHEDWTLLSVPDLAAPVQPRIRFLIEDCK